MFNISLIDPVVDSLAPRSYIHMGLILSVSNIAVVAVGRLIQRLDLDIQNYNPADTLVEGMQTPETDKLVIDKPVMDKLVIDKLVEGRLQQLSSFRNRNHHSEMWLVRIDD